MTSAARGTWKWLRPLLFRLDPELAHRLAVGVAAHAPALVRLLAGNRASDAGRLRVQRMGLDFPNPVGLAAGLDKDAAAVPAWQAMGFGFVEVGTVTALPQPGNPRPRMFRLPADEAVINRMGFNNRGAEAMAVRLTRLRERGAVGIPLGVNIGKSKVTPPQEAAGDYLRSFELLGELADYVVVNISSPNTPGLRDLQSVEQVKEIVGAVQEPNQLLSRPRPILVKLAPDLTDADAIDCARAAVSAGCAGLVLTNTTIRFEGLRTDTSAMSGGLSGRPVFARSTALLRTVRESLGPEPVLIGVGGIMDPDGAAAKLEAGADLIQLYTGLIYGGPGLPRSLLQALHKDVGSIGRA